MHYTLIVSIPFKEIMQRENRMFTEVRITIVDDTHVHDHWYAVTLADAILCCLVSVTKDANQAHKITFQI